MATAADILGTNRKTKVQARWATLYQRLCAERDRLLERDCSAPEGSNVKLDDLSEAGTEESQRCLSLVTASATQANIADVVDAIGRIERGTYGICELTGEPIEPERLKAIPWARYSLQGQNDLEKAGLGRKASLPALESVSEEVLVDGDETEAEPEVEKAEA